MLILDTCALLWLAQGSGLKPSVLKKIELSPVVYISAITGFALRGKLRENT